MRSDCWLRLSLFGTVALHLVQPAQAARALPLCMQLSKLAAFLVLAPGGARSRSELSEVLCDEGADPARPGSVNTALWRLRQVLEGAPFSAGDVLQRHRDGRIGLRADAPLQVDVLGYRQAVAPTLALPLDAIDEAAAEQLRRGAALYAGELLPGVHDDWVLRERENLRQQQLGALGRLVTLSLRSGDCAAGIVHARAMLEIDDLREDVHRNLMRLYLLAGQRALALRQYERCRDTLRRELSIMPMPETQTLYRQIAASAVVGNHAEGAGGHAPAPDQALAELLVAARHHLAAADAQLQRAAPLVG